MQNERPRILFAAGGTGGHVFPALAIADEIRKTRPDADILFVGTKGRIESRIVPAHGYAFRTVWISGFHRRFTVSNLLFPLKLCVSPVQSFLLVRRTRPHVAVGTGGYVCGPVLLAAGLMGVPTVMHESNSYPGFTTRLLAPRMTMILTAFDATRQWLAAKGNVENVGTPTSGSLGRKSRDEGAAHFGLDPSLRTVVVFGGSQGATSINEAVLTVLEHLKQRKVQLIWQTGEKDFRRLRRAVEGHAVGWIGPFIEDMNLAYAIADVAVCRAGATTIAELTRVGLPAILVPYPRAAADHQTHNARTLKEAGAAATVEDKDVAALLGPEMFRLLDDPSRRSAMAAASRALGRPEAARVVANRVLEFAPHVKH